MSDTLNCKEQIKKPQDRTQVDDDISILEAKADYTRSNIFKWFILALLIASITIIAYLFFWNLFTNSIMQKYVLDQISNNIVFIILTVCMILKIKIPNMKI